MSEAPELPELPEVPEEKTPDWDSSDKESALRVLEALLFASAEPLSQRALQEHLPEGADVAALLEDLKEAYSTRGVHLVSVAGKWMFRTAEDLSYLLEREETRSRKLSRAALETLAIIAYHQPVTRAEIEEIRGKTFSSGTLDILFETGWLRLCGRRDVPGRPLTYGVSESFLTHFGLESVKDLPGLDELKSAGLMDMRPPAQALSEAPEESSGEEDAPSSEAEDLIEEEGVQDTATDAA